MLSIMLINDSNKNNINIDQKKLLDIFKISLNCLLDKKNNSLLNEFCSGFEFNSDFDIDVTIKFKDKIGD